MPQPIRILIVEDSDLDVELLIDQLREANFEPYWERVETEQDYLELLRPDLDLIISDFNMPEFSGLRALDLLKEKGHQIPFILVSGTIGEETAICAIKQGATDYLLKDRPERLASAVRQALEQNQLRKEYHQAEKELRKERDFVSTVVDTVGALVVVLDRQGRIVRFNRACEHLTGFSFDEVKGQSLLDLLLLPKERGEVKKVIDNICAGQFPNTFENHWITKRGKLRLITWSNTALLDADRDVEYVIATGVDITDRKQAEKALVESECKFRTLFNAADDAIYMIHDGVFVDCNIKGQTMYGRTRDQIIGHAPEEFSPPLQPDGGSSKDKASEIIQEALAGKSQFFEWMSRHFDGTPVYSEVSLNRLDLGDKTYIQAIARDVTERKRAEEEANHVSRQMQLLLESAGEGIYGTDTEGRCIFINRSASDMLGYSAKETLGRNM